MQIKSCLVTFLALVDIAAPVADGWRSRRLFPPALNSREIDFRSALNSREIGFRSALNSREIGFRPALNKREIGFRPSLNSQEIGFRSALNKREVHLRTRRQIETILDRVPEYGSKLNTAETVPDPSSGTQRGTSSSPGDVTTLTPSLSNDVTSRTQSATTDSTTSADTMRDDVTLLTFAKLVAARESKNDSTHSLNTERRDVASPVTLDDVTLFFDITRMLKGANISQSLNLLSQKADTEAVMTYPEVDLKKLFREYALHMGTVPGADEKPLHDIRATTDSEYVVTPPHLGLAESEDSMTADVDEESGGARSDLQQIRFVTGGHRQTEANVEFISIDKSVASNAKGSIDDGLSSMSKPSSRPRILNLVPTNYPRRHDQIQGDSLVGSEIEQPSSNAREKDAQPDRDVNTDVAALRDSPRPLYSFSRFRYSGPVYTDGEPAAFVYVEESSPQRHIVVSAARADEVPGVGEGREFEYANAAPTVHGGVVYVYEGGGPLPVQIVIPCEGCQSRLGFLSVVGSPSARALEETNFGVGAEQEASSPSLSPGLNSEDKIAISELPRSHLINGVHSVVRVKSGNDQLRGNSGTEPHISRHVCSSARSASTLIPELELPIAGSYEIKHPADDSSRVPDAEEEKANTFSGHIPLSSDDGTYYLPLPGIEGAILPMPFSYRSSGLQASSPCKLAGPRNEENTNVNEKCIHAADISPCTSERSPIIDYRMCSSVYLNNDHVDSRLHMSASDKQPHSQACLEHGISAHSSGVQAADLSQSPVTTSDKILSQAATVSPLDILAGDTAAARGLAEPPDTISTGRRRRRATFEKVRVAPERRPSTTTPRPPPTRGQLTRGQRYTVLNDIHANMRQSRRLRTSTAPPSTTSTTTERDVVLRQQTLAMIRDLRDEQRFRKSESEEHNAVLTAQLKEQVLLSSLTRDKHRLSQMDDEKENNNATQPFRFNIQSPTTSGPNENNKHSSAEKGSAKVVHGLSATGEEKKQAHSNSSGQHTSKSSQSRGDNFKGAERNADLAIQLKEQILRNSLLRKSKTSRPKIEAPSQNSLITVSHGKAVPFSPWQSQLTAPTADTMTATPGAVKSSSRQTAAADVTAFGTAVLGEHRVTSSGNSDFDSDSTSAGSITLQGQTQSARVQFHLLTSGQNKNAVSHTGNPTLPPLTIEDLSDNVVQNYADDGEYHGYLWKALLGEQEKTSSVSLVPRSKHIRTEWKSSTASPTAPSAEPNNTMNVRLKSTFPKVVAERPEMTTEVPNKDVEPLGSGSGLPLKGASSLPRKASGAGHSAALDGGPKYPSFSAYDARYTSSLLHGFGPSLKSHPEFSPSQSSSRAPRPSAGHSALAPASSAPVPKTPEHRPGRPQHVTDYPELDSPQDSSPSHKRPISGLGQLNPNLHHVRGFHPTPTLRHPGPAPDRPAPSDRPQTVHTLTSNGPSQHDNRPEANKNSDFDGDPKSESPPRRPGHHQEQPNGHPSRPDSHPVIPIGHPRRPTGHPRGPGGHPRGPGGHPRGPGSHPRGPGGHPRGPGGHPRGPGGHFRAGPGRRPPPRPRGLFGRMYHSMMRGLHRMMSGPMRRPPPPVARPAAGHGHDPHAAYRPRGRMGLFAMYRSPPERTRGSRRASARERRSLLEDAETK